MFGGEGGWVNETGCDDEGRYAAHNEDPLRRSNPSGVVQCRQFVIKIESPCAVVVVVVFWSALVR
jgi:hypothetical protein